MISHHLVILAMTARPGSEEAVDRWFDEQWGRQLLGVEGLEWESKHILESGSEQSARGGAPRYLVLYGVAPSRVDRARTAVDHLIADPSALHPEIDSSTVTVGGYALRAYYQFLSPDPIGRPDEI
jgi:hypothetical protein